MLPSGTDHPLNKNRPWAKDYLGRSPLVYVQANRQGKSLGGHYKKVRHRSRQICLDLSPQPLVVKLLVKAQGFLWTKVWVGLCAESFWPPSVLRRSAISLQLDFLPETLKKREMRRWSQELNGYVLAKRSTAFRPTSFKEIKHRGCPSSRMLYRRWIFHVHLRSSHTRKCVLTHLGWMFLHPLPPKWFWLLLR